jgi:hypothetical protein
MRLAKIWIPARLLEMKRKGLTVWNQRRTGPTSIVDIMAAARYGVWILIQILPDDRLARFDVHDGGDERVIADCNVDGREGCSSGQGWAEEQRQTEQRDTRHRLNTFCARSALGR